MHEIRFSHHLKRPGMRDESPIHSNEGYGFNHGFQVVRNGFRPSVFQHTQCSFARIHPPGKSRVKKATQIEVAMRSADAISGIPYAENATHMLRKSLLKEATQIEVGPTFCPSVPLEFPRFPRRELETLMSDGDRREAPAPGARACCGCTTWR